MLRLDESGRGLMIGDKGGITINNLNDYQKNDAGIKLIRSEEKFDKLFEYSPVGMAMIKHETGEFIEVNRALLEWTGYTKEEFLNLSFWDITPLEYQEQEQQQMLDLESKGRFGPNEKEYIRKDGSRFPIRLKGFIIEDVDGTKLVWGIIEDISNEYRRIFEALQDAYIQFDLSYKLTMVNQGTVKMFGYTTKDEMIGMNLEELFADHSIFKKIKDDLKMRNRISNCICECVRKDGTSLWMSFNAQHIKDNKDVTFSMEGIMHDITYIRQTEEALEESEERFRLMVESISDTIGITDVNGNVKFRSPNNEELFGIKSEDLIGQNSFDYVHPDDRERLNNEFIGLIEDGVGAKRNGEFKYLRMDGSTVTVELEGKNLLDNKLIDGLFLTFRDITERKLMENSLKESEERFRGIISSMDDVVYTLDTKQRHTGVFGSWVEKSNLSEDVFIGKTASEIFGPEIGKVHEIPTRKALAGENAVYEWDIISDNERNYYQTSLSPMYDGTGKVSGVVGIGRDITKIKEAENKLLSSAEEYQKAQEMGSVGHWYFNPETNEFWGSPEALKIYGYPEDSKVPFENIANCLSAKDAEKIVQDLFALVNQGTPFNAEFDIIPKNSSEIRSLWSVAEMKKDQNGKPIVGGVLQDITERKTIRKELMTSLEQNKRILDNLQDAYFQADLSGCFIIVNPRAVSMYGYQSFNEMIGKPAQILYANSEDRNQLIQKLKESGALTDYTCRGRKKDGTVFDVSMNVQFVKDASGKIVGTEGLVRDITDRMILEDELENEKNNLKISNQKLSERLNQSVMAISKIGEMRDVYTAGHQKGSSAWPVI